MFRLLKLYRIYVKLFGAGSFLTRRFIARAAASMSSSSTGGICLDVGAGTVPYRQEISRHFQVAHYLSVDFTSGDSIDVIADARSLPIPDRSIDLVV